jgi:hypothetical protein
MLIILTSNNRCSGFTTSLRHIHHIINARRCIRIKISPTTTKLITTGSRTMRESDEHTLCNTYPTVGRSAQDNNRLRYHSFADTKQQCGNELSVFFKPKLVAEQLFLRGAAPSCEQLFGSSRTDFASCSGTIVCISSCTATCRFFQRGLVTE